MSYPVTFDRRRSSQDRRRIIRSEERRTHPGHPDGPRFADSPLYPEFPEFEDDLPGEQPEERRPEGTVTRLPVGANRKH